MEKLTTLLSKESLAKGEKYTTLFIYYILPVIVVITLISAMTNANNIGFSRQEFRGSRGRNLLAIVLFIKPITFFGKKYLKAESITLEQTIIILKDLPKTIKKHQKEINGEILLKHVFPFIVNNIYSISLYLMRFRRQLGIASFRFLFTHGILREIFRIRQGFTFFFNFTETAIRSGILGLIALITIAITSNDYAIKKLEKNRKKIQMIAYLAFFFGAIHTGNTFWLIAYFVAKYFERKDTGILQIWIDRLSKKRETIKTNKWIQNQLHTIKNNKQINKYRTKIKNRNRINETIDKICKK